MKLNEDPEYQRWKHLAIFGPSLNLTNSKLQQKPHKPTIAKSKTKTPAFSQLTERKQLKDLHQREQLWKDGLEDVTEDTRNKMRKEIHEILSGRLNPANLNKSMKGTQKHFFGRQASKTSTESRNQAAPKSLGSAEDIVDLSVDELTISKSKKSKALKKEEDRVAENEKVDANKQLGGEEGQGAAQENTQPQVAKDKEEEIDEEDLLDEGDIMKVHSILERYDPINPQAFTLTQQQQQEQSPELQPTATQSQSQSPNTIKKTKKLTRLMTAVEASAQKEDITGKIDEYFATKQLEGNLAIGKQGLPTELKKGQKKLPMEEKLLELQSFVQKELQRQNCPSEGPDYNRLEIYGTCFDQIIQEFNVYGPILAQIKNEYDKMVSSFRNDKYELMNLRSKVQKLVSLNENRLLLKYEKEKYQELVGEYEKAKFEHQILREDLEYKVGLYASYLPPNFLAKRKTDDELLAELAARGKVVPLPPGEDPLSKYELQIQDLTRQVSTRDERITELLETRVPKTDYDHSQKSLKEAQQQISELEDKNDQLQAKLTVKEREVDRLETEYREKEELYNKLTTDYNDLQDLIANNFDERLQSLLRSKLSSMASVGGDGRTGTNADLARAPSTSIGPNGSVANISNRNASQVHLAAGRNASVINMRTQAISESKESVKRESTSSNNSNGSKRPIDLVKKM